MKVKLVLVGAISFSLGVVSSLLLYPRITTRHLSSEGVKKEKGRSFVHAKSLIESKGATPARRPLDFERELAERERKRDFISLDRDSLGSPSEILEWGFTEEEATAISRNYKDAVERAKSTEAQVSILKVDENGDEYMSIPPHNEESSVNMAALEESLEAFLSRETSRIIADQIFSAIYYKRGYRRDILEQTVHLTKNQNGRVSYHERLLDENGAVKSSSVSWTDTNSIPKQYRHLFDARD